MKIGQMLLITVGTLLITAHAYAGEQGHHGKHWSYNGAEGPQKWGKICEEYATCMKGVHQSPINITGASDAMLDNITFNYKENKLDIINNGHTIQANMESGNSITIDNETYNLLQFHFHTPSEHQFDGKNLVAEMHLVHKSESGKLAVVGVLMEKGSDNEKLKIIWDKMPTVKDGHVEDDAIKINPSELLPEKTVYSRYSGSLTTPPCSEEVKWFVMGKTVMISDKQLTKFNTVIGKNARPVQSLNERVVKQK